MAELIVASDNPDVQSDATPPWLRHPLDDDWGSMLGQLQFEFDQRRAERRGRFHVVEEPGP
jgi:hypothetical protein